MNTPITHPTMPDERAIENLMVEYAYRNDDFDIQGLGELFADAAFTLDGLTVQNRSEVEGLAARRFRRGRVRGVERVVSGRRVGIGRGIDRSRTERRVFSTRRMTIGEKPRDAGHGDDDRAEQRSRHG